MAITAEDKSDEDQNIPAKIKALLQDCEYVIFEPKQLPTIRVYDHSIPLIKGDELVNMRPYKTSFTQRD